MGDVSITSALNNIYKAILENNNIIKYIYYPSTDFNDDPLAKADVSNTDAFKHVKKVSGDYLITQVINNSAVEEETEKRGYMTVFLDDGERFDNPFASDYGARIEIYMPVRGFEEFQFRIASVIEELNGMFQQKKVDGSLGRLVLTNSFNISDAGEGYVGYAHIYNVGNVVSAR